jgi:hypothetical protein
MTVRLYFRKEGGFRVSRYEKDREYRDKILENCDFYFENYTSFIEKFELFVECDESTEQVERCIENISINAPWLSFAGWRIYDELGLTSYLVVKNCEINKLSTKRRTLYEKRNLFGKNKKDATGDLEDAERDGED